jgi:hypothetical protein
VLIARFPRPSRKVVSTLQVSRFMARQIHDGIPGNAAVGSNPRAGNPQSLPIRRLKGKLGGPLALPPVFRSSEGSADLPWSGGERPQSGGRELDQASESRPPAPRTSARRGASTSIPASAPTGGGTVEVQPAPGALVPGVFDAHRRLIERQRDEPRTPAPIAR